MEITKEIEELKKDSLGIVHTQYFTFAEPPDPLQLKSGRSIGPVTTCL